MRKTKGVSHHDVFWQRVKGKRKSRKASGVKGRLSVHTDLGFWYSKTEGGLTTRGHLEQLVRGMYLTSSDWY